MALERPLETPPRLAAQNSHEKTYVFFLNTTHRRVNLYWIDFAGCQDLFITLRSGAGVKVDTFVTHPWIFRDEETGERMHVKHQDVYWPQLYRVRDPHVSGWIPCRKLIPIHLPVQTLRSTCLWSYARFIFRPCEVSLENLALPQTLQRDLKNILNIVAKHRTTVFRGINVE